MRMLPWLAGVKYLVGQRHFAKHTNPKRKRGNTLRQCSSLALRVSKIREFTSKWRCRIRYLPATPLAPIPFN